MAAFHHGISAQEKTQGIMPMRNANVSVIGLVVTSTDADDIMYPSDTPVLLTGITQDNIDNAGTNGTLRDCLQAIRDIHNPTIVILRVSEPLDVDTLDVLLTCQSRFGLMPKRLGAPEIDTPDVVLKLVSIAKRRRGMVYAQPRDTEGTLITDKALIAAYRDTYGDRELCIIDGEWGVPGKSDGAGSFNWASLALNNEVVLDGMADGIDEFEAEINGVAYNKDNSDGGLANALFGLNILDVSANPDSLTFTNLTNEVLNVKLTASEYQSAYSTKFILGEGEVQDGNIFLFRLGLSR